MNGAEQYRIVRPDGPQALLGIQVLVGGSAELGNNFLEYAHQQNLDLSRQVLAVSGVTIAGMCLWVAAPGKTALLFTPRMGQLPEVTAAATALAARQAVQDARDAGVVLVQAMVEPNDVAGAALLAHVGLRTLARLIYMERRPPLLPPHMSLPDTIHLEPYSAATHHLFGHAIVQSYVQTLDCPALSGLRHVDDVIAGHQAVGRFDPQLWSVLVEAGRPIGCLLLAEVPARSALELVYLGLAPEARGRGLGRMLMNRVLGIGSHRHFGLMSLAVDADNTPALALYRRCGYRRVAERLALIQQLHMGH